MTSIPDYPDDPYAGLTCRLEIPGMEAPENATVAVVTTHQGYAAVTVRIDEQRFAKLTFTDHQFRNMVQAYMATLPPVALMTFQEHVKQHEQE